MTTPMRMEEDRSHMTERILNLTLEIIYLLTGESYPVVKSEGQVTIMTPPPHSLKPERNHEKKILEVTQKMMELLTEEIGSLSNIKKEIKEEDDVTEKSEFLIFEDIYKDTMVGSSRYQKPPERSPHPLYSHQDPTMDEDIMVIKVEDEEEEPYVRDDQQYTEEEAGMRRTFIEEDTPTNISTGHEKPAKDDVTLSPGCKMEDEGMTGEKTMSSAMDGGRHSVDRAWIPSDSEHPPTVWEEAGIHHTTRKLYSCPQCGKYFSHVSNLYRHQRLHTGEKPYSCPECGKCFSHVSNLYRHQRVHTGGKLYSCPECGKCFSQASHLHIHQRLHTTETFNCPDCGKCFLQKSELVKHQRCHTGEKPYSCLECGKSFSQKSHLHTHERSHTGEKPYSCLECGKCFSEKSHLNIHERSHTGERPYSCPECGKCFSQKSHLHTHQRSHTGEKPFFCSECGRCFAYKSSLKKHKISHTAK